MIVYEFYFMLCAHSVFFCLQIWSMHINITLLKLACVFRFCFLHLNNECMWISWNFNTSKRKRKRKPFFFHSIQFNSFDAMNSVFGLLATAANELLLCYVFTFHQMHFTKEEKKEKRNYIINQFFISHCLRLFVDFLLFLFFFQTCSRSL